MIKFTIDGARHTGCYQVRCECGDTWTGQGEAQNAYSWSPALPIAECIAHMKMAHPEGMIHLVFSERFDAWLIDYWQRQQQRQQREARERRGPVGPAR